MNNYDRLIQVGIEHLKKELQAQGKLSDSQIREVSYHISNMNFPALLGFLANRKDSVDHTPVGESFLEFMAQKVADRMAGKGNLDAGLIKEAIKAFLVKPGRHYPFPHQPLQARDVPDVFENFVLEFANETDKSITDEEARRIAKLLVSGEFFSDVSQSTAAVFSLAPGLPIALVSDIQSIPLAPSWLLGAIVQDLARFPSLLFDADDILRDILDNGKIERPPQMVLSNTFKALYGLATVSSVVKTVNTLIDKDNETVRMALVIYARVNGIPLQEEDLDVLNQSVFNTASPDLGPALAVAFNRLVELRGGYKPGEGLNSALQLLSMLGV